MNVLAVLETSTIDKVQTGGNVGIKEKLTQVKGRKSSKSKISTNELNFNENIITVILAIEKAIFRVRTSTARMHECLLDMGTKPN